MLTSLNVLGVQVSAINVPMALSTISQWIQAGEKRYVCVTGVHGIMESQRDDSLRQIHNAAGLVTPDGMPLVWIGRLRGLKHITRVYGPDLMLAVCERSVSLGWRHYFYGGRVGVPELLGARLRERFPGLKVVGTCSPPFRSLSAEEDDEMVEQINSTMPDIVWVGLGTPKQERWMAAHVQRLGAAVSIGVGAAFDLHSGLMHQAPRWMQRSGLEWLYRLLREPRRLWRRYLINNPLFLARIVAERVGIEWPRSHQSRA